MRQRKRPKRKFNLFDPISVDAPLWILLPRAFGAILFSNVLLLLIFLLAQGEINVFTFGFLIFFSVLQILVLVGLRFRNRRFSRIDQKFKGDGFDKIGAWWLMACAGGAFFGWMAANLAEYFPELATAFLAAAVVLTIILPVLTMLPLLRYLETGVAYIQIPILFFVTVLPVLVGINSLFKLFHLLAGK